MYYSTSRTLSILSIAFITFFSSCKKDSDQDPYEIDKSQVYLSDSYESNLRDSVWYYYKVLSLWQDVIPPTTTTDASKIDEAGYIRDNYTKYFQTAEKTLDYLMSLTKNRNPNRTPELNYDWYSFLDRGSVVSSSIQESSKSGLGMSVFYLQTASSGTNADLYIRYVDPNSPAAEANLQRGDQIISINGDTKLDYDYQKANDFKPINSFLNASSITIKVKKVNGSTEEKSLSYKYYYNNPILMSKVITTDSKKVGYFVLNSFASIKSQGIYTTFYRNLETMFSNFEQQGINDLIIDLRYNGGGDVETAEYFADRIAPSGESGKVMYTYKINKYLEDWGWLNEGEEFAPIKFQKRGSLTLNRVYFLVSPNTASASELLINSLKPVMTTYMVGTYSVDTNNKDVADKTYGKPVGFFGLSVVDDNVELYAASFKMHNRNGEGDYFEGLTPSTNVWEFKNFQDFGNTDETMLASALSHIKSGSFTSNSLRASVNDLNTDKISKTKSSSAFDNSISNSGMYKFKKENLKKN